MYRSAGFPAYNKSAVPWSGRSIHSKPSAGSAAETVTDGKVASIAIMMAQ
jgi:hypothetical protein